MGEEPKRYYPVFLDLDARLAIVIGGGAAAERRVRQLRRYGADVTVISRNPGPALLEAESAGELTVEHRDYVRGDLEGAAIAVCVSADEEIRHAVHAEAESAGCLLNVSDAPEMCSFIVPAVVNREPLQIAVSTGGLAPGLTKQIRQEIGATYGPEWGPYARLLGEVRAIAYEVIDDDDKRAAVLEGIAGADLLEQIRAGESLDAADLVSTQLSVSSVIGEDE